MWKLSVTKPDIISHSLPISSRLPMTEFTFMKTPLGRPKFSKKKIRENLNRLFIHEVIYERKLIRRWTVLVYEIFNQMRHYSFHCKARVTLVNLLHIFFDSYSANTQSINVTTLKINVIM